MTKTIAILGSGFSSLAASCYLAQQGNKVTIYEKNESIGGRARQFKKDGFTFDMGPSWYWMPDVFEKFFNDFNKKTGDYYELIKLNPAYRVYFGINDFINIYDNLAAIKTTFEGIEKGSGSKLEAFINQAKSNYDIAIKDLVYRPGVSPLELITPQTALKLNQFFSTSEINSSSQIQKHIFDFNKSNLVYLTKNRKNNDVSFFTKNNKDIIIFGGNEKINEAGKKISEKARELVKIYNQEELKPSSPLFRGNIFKRCLAVIKKGKFKILTSKKKKQQEYSFIKTEKNNRIIAIKN
jgi:hypothetical protein